MKLRAMGAVGAALAVLGPDSAALSQAAPIPVIPADADYKGSTAKNPLGTLVYASPQAPAAARSPTPADAGVLGPTVTRPDPQGRKRVLFVGDTYSRTPLAHESVHHAMAVLEIALRKAGYVVHLRSDTRSVSRGPVFGAYAADGSLTSPGRNLNDYAVVIYYSSGETEMNQAQKRDLISFVRDDGKGFVGIHTASVSLHTVPEYGQMLGGYFDTHPWFVSEARLKVERPDFPGLAGFIANPTVRDEHYQFREPFSRTDVDVLMSIDNTSIDLANPNIHRTDNDFPVTWIKNYGKGKVFYSYLGHTEEAWDDPRIQAMYVEAVRWAAGEINYQPSPHPKVQ